MPPEGVNPVQFPELMEEVWEWFLDIGGRRRKAGFGPELVEWPAMESYFRLMRVDPDPWQVRVIGRLDLAWYKAQTEEK